MANERSPSVEAVVTDALKEMDGVPGVPLQGNEYLKVSTPEGCTRVRVTRQGEIEIHTTNAPHKSNPELQVLPVQANVILIRTEMK